jgi:hypothetical protein
MRSGHTEDEILDVLEFVFVMGFAYGFVYVFVFAVVTVTYELLKDFFKSMQVMIRISY